MRGFFALLLLSNLLFLGGQFWVVHQEMVPVMIIPSHPTTKDEGLRLLSELDEGARPAPRQMSDHGPKPTPVLIQTERRDLVQVPAAEQAAFSCYQSMPLVTLAEAEILQKRLFQLGIRETKRSTVQTTKVNYWVMLRPYENEAKAKEALDMLKEKRIRDLFVVRSGRYENAISLGVYSTLERAEQRFKEIADLKVRLRKPQIEELELPTKRLVVSFQLTQEGLDDGLASMLVGKEEGILEKIGCK